MPFNLKNLYHIIHIQRISERLWRVFYLKHFCILGFAQKETISLIHDTLCAWCYRTRNEKIFLRVQEQKNISSANSFLFQFSLHIFTISFLFFHCIQTNTRLYPKMCIIFKNEMYIFCICMSKSDSSKFYGSATRP